MKRTLLALTVVALLLLSACGPSLAEFVTQADKVCEKYNKLVSATAAPDSVAKIKEAADGLAQDTRKLANDVSKIKAPRGDDGKKVETFLSNLRAAASAAEETSAAAAKEDLPGMEAALNKTKTAFKKVDDQARAAGFKVCGQGGAKGSTTLATASPAVLKSAYIGKADAICAVINKEIEALPEPITDKEFTQFVEKVKTLVDKFVADIRAVPPATVDKTAVDEILSLNDQVLAKLKQALDAANGGKFDVAISALEEAGKLGDAANMKADAFGMKDCGSAGA